MTDGDVGIPIATGVVGHTLGGGTIYLNPGTEHTLYVTTQSQSGAYELVR